MNNITNAGLAVILLMKKPDGSRERQSWSEVPERMLTAPNELLNDRDVFSKDLLHAISRNLHNTDTSTYAKSWLAKSVYFLQGGKGVDLLLLTSIPSRFLPLQ